MFSMIHGAVGYARAALEYTVHQSTQLGATCSEAVAAIIIDIDRLASGHNSIWLRVFHNTPHHQSLLNAVVNLSSKDLEKSSHIDAAVEMLAVVPAVCDVLKADFTISITSPISLCGSAKPFKYFAQIVNGNYM